MKKIISIVIALSMILAISPSVYAAFELDMNEVEQLSGVTVTNVYKGTGAITDVVNALKTVLVDNVFNVEGQVTATNLTGGHWQVNKNSSGDFIKFDLGAVKTVDSVVLHGGTGTTSVIAESDISKFYFTDDNGDKVSVTGSKIIKYSAAQATRGRNVVYLHFAKPVSTKTLTMGAKTATEAALRVGEIQLWNTGDNKLFGNAGTAFYPASTDNDVPKIGYVLTDGYRSGPLGVNKWYIATPTNLNTSPYTEFDVNAQINKIAIYSAFQSKQDAVIPDNVGITYTTDGINWKTAKVLAKTDNAQTADVSEGWISTYTIGAITPKSIRIYVPYGRGDLNNAGEQKSDNAEGFRIREIGAYFDDSFTESSENGIFALRMDETSDFTSVNSSTIVKKDAVISKGAKTRTFLMQFPTPVSDKTFTVNDTAIDPVFETKDVSVSVEEETVATGTANTGKVYTALFTIGNMNEGTSWTVKADDEEVYNFSIAEDYKFTADFVSAGGNHTYSGSVKNNTANSGNINLYMPGYDKDGNMVSIDVKKVPLGSGETTDFSLSIPSTDVKMFKVFLWDDSLTPLKSPINPCEEVSLNNEALSYYGRWSEVDDSMYGNWNHPYIKFAFTGKKLQIDATNAEYLAVTIDGARKTYRDVNGLIDVTPESLTDKQHTATIRLWKTSIAQNQAINGIYIGSGESVSKIEPTKNVLQFIGDSITTDPASYSYTIPEKLGYDFSIISLSGIALQDGCGWYQKNVGDGTVKTKDLIGMESAYFNLQNPLYDYTGTTATPYDFANEDPNVIVINLGANDNEYIRLPETYAENGKTKDTYIESYVNFVKAVQSKHPDADIYLVELLVQTSPYTVTLEAQQEVYNRLKSNSKIHFIDTTDWNIQSESETNPHPTPSEYARLRDLIIGKIQPSFK